MVGSTRTVLTAAAVLPLLALASCSGDADPGTDPAADPGVELQTGPAAAPVPGEDGATGDPEDGATAETEAQGSAPLSVTIAASGDVLPHTWVNVSARMYAGASDRSLVPPPDAEFDYAPMFADIADLVGAADLSLCHLETPLSPDNTNLSVPDTLSFNTPHEMADALAGAGYDGCDFASNHTLDRGMQGLADTEQVLRDAGLGFAGPTADEERSGRAEIYEVTADGGTAQVAHLAYTYTYPNAAEPNTDIPDEAPWLVDGSWPSIGSEGILEQAGTARQEGADFVVVSMHWGNEYQAEPTADQREIAQDLLGSDAVDLILGTHVHVIQPCEQINDKHVLYGLGNSLSNQSPMTASVLSPATQEGMVAVVTLTRDEDGDVSSAMTYQPTRVEIPPEIAPGHIIRNVTPDTHPETWERTTSTIDMLGGCGAEAIEHQG